VQVRVAVAERAHFELLENLDHALGGTAQRGHDDQRAGVGRNPASKVQFRYRARRDLVGHEPVDQVERQLADRDDDHEGGQQEQGPVRAMASSVDQQARDRQRRQQRDAPEIACGRMPERKACQPLTEARWIAGLTLDLKTTTRDQVVADMVGSIATGVGGHRGRRERARAFRDRNLVPLGSPRQLLDRLPVPVARGEVHLWVRAGRIAPQHAFHAAHALEERRPVERGQQPHAADHVADRQLRRGFPLALAPDDLFGPPCRSS
jgi:hypothetical protein